RTNVTRTACAGCRRDLIVTPAQSPVKYLNSWRLAESWPIFDPTRPRFPMLFAHLVGSLNRRNHVLPPWHNEVLRFGGRWCRLQSGTPERLSAAPSAM